MGSSDSVSKLVNFFDGSNYPSWSRKIEVFLLREDLFSVVDGTEKRPVTPPATPGGTINHTPLKGPGSKSDWDLKD